MIFSFLSTPSARRATRVPWPVWRDMAISIHALREEGDMHLPRGRGCLRISIHALREEGDIAGAGSGSFFFNFYPRPPRGGRPEYLGDLRVIKEISIHALREEGDSMPSRARGLRGNFYPRPPRGGRPQPSFCCSDAFAYFYPRPPRGGRQQKQRQNLYFLINYTTFCTNLEEP